MTDKDNAPQGVNIDALAHLFVAALGDIPDDYARITVELMRDAITINWPAYQQNAGAPQAGAWVALEKWLGTWADSIPAQAYRELCALQSQAQQGGVTDAVATVRWHPKHGFNWKSLGDGPCGDIGTGWVDVPVYAALQSQAPDVGRLALGLAEEMERHSVGQFSGETEIEWLDRLEARLVNAHESLPDDQIVEAACRMVTARFAALQSQAPDETAWVDNYLPGRRDALVRLWSGYPLEEIARARAMLDQAPDVGRLRELSRDWTRRHYGAPDFPPEKINAADCAKELEIALAALSHQPAAQEGGITRMTCHAPPPR